MMKIPFFLILLFVFCASSLQASTFTTAQNLNFGAAVPLASYGYIDLSTAGGVIGGSAQPVLNGAYYQGIVRFQGTELSSTAQNMAVTVLSSSVTLTSASGPSITTTNFVLSRTTVPVSSSSPNVDISLGGRVVFYSTPSGTYTGTIQIRITGAPGTFTTTVPITIAFKSPLSITEISPMHFGNVQVGTTAGIVRLYSSLGQTAIVSGTGVVILPNPPAQAGRFLIQGEPNAVISIYYPDPVVLTGPGGAQVTINNFNCEPFFYPSPSLNAAGQLTLLMGAEISFAANQRMGTYTGTYTVQINY